MAVQNFDGAFWQAKVESSNRWGDRIEFTSISGDGYFKVPESRVQSTVERLESGEDPDIVAQSFPIDEKPVKNSNRQIGDRPKVQKTFRLDADLIESMMESAASQRITLTEALEKAIAQYLNK